MPVALALASCIVLPAGMAQAADAPPKKRTLPNYDGRGGPPTSPERTALWVPRVLLSPVYFVTEYMLRRPLGAGVTYAERHGWPGAIYQFLALDVVVPVGVVPFFFVDFGSSPSVGLYVYWNDAGFKGHQLRFRGSTWGPSWLTGTATERFELRNLEITLSTTLTKRPDYAFYGIGPDSREEDLVRYAATSAFALFSTALSFNGRSSLVTSAGYRGASFGHSDYGGDDSSSPDYQPSLDEAVAAGELTEPPGYRDGYKAAFAGVRLALDSRGRSLRTSGVRLDVATEQSVDLANSPSSGWLRYGGTLSAFADLTGGARTLSASLAVLLVDPVGDRPVPFTQLASLGGGRTMAGFRNGRLYDRSAAVGTLRYAWPIWFSLRGALQAAVGNVFDAHYAGFRAGRLRLSTAFGFETTKDRDSVFQILVGVGTETFESGAALNSLHFSMGSRTTF